MFLQILSLNNIFCDKFMTIFCRVNILLRTPDSALLPYKLTEGLCPPPTPESTKEKKALQEKVQCVQSELHKRKKEFYEEAKRKRIETSEVCVNKACDEKRANVDETIDDKRSSDNNTCDYKKETIGDQCSENRENISEIFVDQKAHVSEMSTPIDKKDLDMDCEVSSSITNNL